jgi:hypothetical protein
LNRLRVHVFATRSRRIDFDCRRLFICRREGVDAICQFVEPVLYLEQVRFELRAIVVDHSREIKGIAHLERR